MIELTHRTAHCSLELQPQGGGHKLPKKGKTLVQKYNRSFLSSWHIRQINTQIIWKETQLDIA